MTVPSGRTPLSLTFKGERNYLQGPDLLTGLLDRFAAHGLVPDGDISVVFYRKTDRQPEILPTPPDGGRPDTAFGHWSITAGDEQHSGWFLESDRPVTGRLPYDEESTVAQCRLHDETVAFAGTTPLTATELCVAMTKMLHIALFPLPREEHWVVSRFVLPRPLIEDDKAGMRISLDRKLGNKLTKSVLTVTTGQVGAIFFSAAKR